MTLAVSSVDTGRRLRSVQSFKACVLLIFLVFYLVVRCPPLNVPSYVPYRGQRKEHGGISVQFSKIQTQN